MTIKKIFPVVDLLLITLAIYLGVKGFYAFFSNQLDTLPPAATVGRPPTVAENIRRPPSSDYRAIAERNLFNTRKNGEKPTPDIIVDSLEQTQLKLKLWGTSTGDEEYAYAIIEDEKDRQQKLYKLGDTIQNATVKMILRNKVVLSLLGKDEILEAEKINEKSVPATSSVSRRASTSSPITRSMARRRISLSRAQVDDAMSNINDLMTQINIQPHSENGQPDGMALNNIRPNSIFRRMGLRNGDVLTAIDGRPITTVDQALKLYEDLRSSDSANIEIKRRGRPTTIEYNIR